MASFKQSKIKFGFLETATSGGTLTLTSSAVQYQILTGTLGHSVVLPAATSLFAGVGFNVINNSTASITVYYNDGTTILMALAAGTGLSTIVTDNTTSNGLWDVKSGGASSAGAGMGSGVGSTVVSGNKGIIAGGPSGTPTAVIDYLIMSNASNATSFGSLTQARYGLSGVSNSIRGVFGAGVNGGTQQTTIDYITIATLSNATTFGNLTLARYQTSACSNATTGIFAGGSTNVAVANIDYITIATTGNATSFGNLSVARLGPSGAGSPTRGIFSGGATNPAGTAVVANIDYVTIATVGNATTFGNLTTARVDTGSCSSATRGLTAGGNTTVATNIIDYVTIATVGNSTTFGNLSVSRFGIGGFSSPVTGFFAGGSTGSFTALIDFVAIATLNNTTSFGNLTSARSYVAACSDSHGGL